MIQDTLAELEARIEKAGAVKPESKAELLRLLSTLRGEIEGLSKTHGEDAESIAGFTSVSAHEVMRAKKNPELVNLSLQGLSSSVTELERSHPALVQIVNRICETLANLGI
jgi:predicted transcriptional regulator